MTVAAAMMFVAIIVLAFCEYQVILPIQHDDKITAAPLSWKGEQSTKGSTRDVQAEKRSSNCFSYNPFYLTFRPSPPHPDTRRRSNGSSNERTDLLLRTPRLSEGVDDTGGVSHATASYCLSDNSKRFVFSVLS